MAIRPAFQIGRKERQYFASKQFTDRVRPREVFFNKIKEMKSRSYSDYKHEVIVYYGVGGIGKTSLQKQLKKELLDHEPNALYSSIDFKDYTLHTPARALLELVREMVHRTKLSFPHFEIAYSIYFHKRNPDFAFNEKKLPFEKELSILATMIGTLDGMGLAGTVSGLIGKIYDTKKNWNLDKEVKEYLKELETDNVQEIEEKLIAFFTYDLQANIEKQQIPNAVIFLDTFEALWSGVNNKTTIHTKDKWVRDLIGSLPEVLFVICGREYLEWEKYDAEWKDILDHHIIENLDYKDAAVFLETCGVEEPEIRDKMISSSRGYPYHLDLSVDTYFEMKNRGEKIELSKFGSNQREVLDRFLQYLTDDEIETLKIMSTPRFYNKDIFSHLLAEHPTGYSITKYDEFNKFSFVTKEGNKFFIHALMRQGILEYSSEGLISDVHRTMADYYEQKFIEYSTATLNQEKELQTLGECIFHKKALLNPENFINWLSQTCLPSLNKLQLRGEARFLRETLGSLYAELGAKGIGISLMQILIDMVHLKGEYHVAIEMIDELFDGLSTEQILATNQGAHLAIRKVHHKMFFEPVEPLMNELLSYEAELAKKNWATEYNELLFMLGGNLGVLSGNLKFSRKYLVKSIRYAMDTDLDNYLCRALRKYTDVLKEYGHLRWARHFCEQGIEVARSGGYARYEAILVCTLADLYRMEGKYQMARELCDEAMKMIKKVGIKGWEGHIHLILAELHYQKGEYEVALAQFKNACEIYETISQKWGLIQANIGLERCRLKGFETEGLKPIEHWMNEAKRLNYRREERLAKLAGNGDEEVMVLAFL